MTSNNSFKFCTQCGAGLDINANFCGECGNPMRQPLDIEQQPFETSRTALPRYQPNTQSSLGFWGNLNLLGKIAIITVPVLIIIGFITCLAPDVDNNSTTPESKPIIKPTKASIPTTNTPEPKRESPQTYQGCDGLEEVIELVPTDGLGKMQLQSIVNIGDDYSCTKTIQGLGFGNSSDPVPTSTPFNNTNVTYKGCDGLNEVIDLVPTDGLAKMQLWSVVNMGDEASCDRAIQSLGFK